MTAVGSAWRSLTALPSVGATTALAASLAGISVLGFVASTVLLGLSGDATDLSSRPARLSAVSSLGFLAFPIVGGLVASRRSRNPIGWVVIALGLCFALVQALNAYATFSLVASDPLPGSALAAWGFNWIIAPLLPLLAMLLLLFPDGRPPSPRWRVVLWLSWLGGGALATWGALLAESTPPSVPVARPLVLPGAEAVLGAIGKMAIALGGASMVLAGSAIAVRLRRARGVERLQLKWMAFAGLIFGVALGLDMVVAIAYGPVVSAQVGAVPISIALAALPIAASIAILRHRLYDIDLLIKRTVTYGASSVAIAATFVVGVVALQAILRPLIAGSELAVAASTLGSVAVFHPIRRWVQDAVDRRFDRSRYDAVRAIGLFSRRLRDEVDLNAVRVDLLDAVRQTMAPAHASLWLGSRDLASGRSRTVVSGSAGIAKVGSTIAGAQRLT